MSKLLSTVLAWLAFGAAAALAQPTTHQFESEIRAFEASDKTNPPPRQALLFVGSSSIGLWKSLARDFPEYPVINRGFGGSQIADAIHYANRIVTSYDPRLIVFYAGGNDIDAGKSAETVFADFQRFVQIVQQQCPRARVAYISIAPNPARWSQVDRVREANRLIEQFTRSDSRLSFINVFPRMLGPDGQPRPEIFVDDKLHMNAEGYKLWTEMVRQHLRELWKK